MISDDSCSPNENILNELYTLVQNDLFSQLNIRLGELPNASEYLTTLTWHGQEQLSLLMVAALNGSDEIVRALLIHCDPKLQIELKGRIVISDEEYLKGATALYCACYRKHFTVVRTLIELGHANVNQDTIECPRYPLLIQASMMNRLDIVSFLVENDFSDVNETKSNDADNCTALIWAAYRGHTSIVKYLIEKGADVNYTCTSRCEYLTAATPLACATLKDDAVSVKLLYDAGAHTNVRNNRNETLMELAVSRRCFSVVNLFLELLINTVEDLELAACFCIKKNSLIVTTHNVLDFLRLALKYRESTHKPKMCRQPIAMYDYAQECQTIDELDAIESDRCRIFIETILVQERILLPQIPQNAQQLIRSWLHYGGMLITRGEYEKCLCLLTHTFNSCPQMELRIVLLLFVDVFCKMITVQKIISVDSFVQVCYLTLEKSQNESRDLILDNTLFLIALATKVLEQPNVTSDQKASIYRWIHDFCQQKLMSSDGRTLIHRCVDVKTNEELNLYETSVTNLIRFPNESGLRLLLTCGHPWLNLDAIESSNGNTALHVICSGSENKNIIELLVNAGSHVDCVNQHGKLPIDYVKNSEIRTFLMSKLVPSRLKCLCARFIAKKRLDITHLSSLSSALNQFILLHGGVRIDTHCDDER